jgi:CRISPR type I-E-associated protein CasB/Cse2
MSQSFNYPDHIRRFLGGLRKLCGSHPDQRPPNPGARANLRRGASATTRHLAWPVVRQCGGDLRHPAWTAIGTAFAFYPQPEREPKPAYNFGATCFGLAAPTRRKDKSGRVISSFDPRFRWVLAAESACQLCERILPILRLAKSSKGVDVHYDELLWAVLGWDAEDIARRERIRIRWATSYWQPGTADNDEWTEL